MGGHGDQVGTFGIQPCLRRPGISHRRELAGERRQTGPAAGLSGEQGVHCGGGGMQVPVEQAGQGRIAPLGSFLGGGLFARVTAQQVVHAVAVGARVVNQVGPGQAVQQLGRLRCVGVQERGGGVAVEVRPGMQRGEPESARGLGVQVPVRPRERGPYRSDLVPASVQDVQPALEIGQLRHQRSQWYGRTRYGEFGGHAQRQRQPTAAGGQGRARRRIVVGPGSDQFPQQTDRRVERQDVEFQAHRAVPGHQPRERVTTGDQHGASAGTRQQRTDLFGSVRVIHHDEHAPTGKQAAVRRGPRIHVRRDVPAVHSQRMEEPGQRVRSRQRRTGVVAAHVYVKLPVREAVGDLVRPLQRQGGLAHPGGPADRRNHRRTDAGVGLVQKRVQHLLLVEAANEMPHRGRKLPGDAPALAYPGQWPARCRG
jgi:hypothetical protein